MRLKNSGIHQRINGNLEIKFTKEMLTSFSRLELFKRYFRAIELKDKITAAFKNSGLGGDYKTSEIIFTFISLWITGGSRLRHIRYLAGDAFVQRICGVKKIATERTLSRWLKRFTPATLALINGLKILRFLRKANVLFAVKMLLWKWTGIKTFINDRQRWEKANDELSYFKTELELKKWKVKVPVIIYRKCLTKNNLKSKNFQLDLFDPDDGIYEYQVIATNQNLQAENAFDFYNGRCAMEREIAELKTEYGFANIPTKSFHANSAYQNLCVLAHTLVKCFQMDTQQAPKRNKSASRTDLFSFESLKSLRFKVVARAGRIVNQSGKMVLKMSDEAKVRSDFEKISAELEKLAA